MHTSVSLYRRHRFPAEIISHCVWLYFRFTLSFRDVEEMLAMRGVTLSYETVREWCLKFGQTYANGLRCRPGQPRLVVISGEPFSEAQAAQKRDARDRGLLLLRKGRALIAWR
jgi:hypothetical protein